MALLMIFSCSHDGIEISMREEDSSPEVVMGWLFRILLHSIDKCLSQIITAKFLYQFIIVDLFVIGTANVIRRHHEIVLFFLVQNS